MFHKPNEKYNLSEIYLGSSFETKGLCSRTPRWHASECQKGTGFPFPSTKMLSWVTHLDERQVGFKLSSGKCAKSKASIEAVCSRQFSGCCLKPHNWQTYPEYNLFVTVGLKGLALSQPQHHPNLFSYKNNHKIQTPRNQHVLDKYNCKKYT